MFLIKEEGITHAGLRSGITTAAPANIDKTEQLLKQLCADQPHNLGGWGSGEKITPITNTDME